MFNSKLILLFGCFAVLACIGNANSDDTHVHTLRFTPNVSRLRSNGVEFNFTLNNIEWKMEIFSVPNQNMPSKYSLEMYISVNPIASSNDTDLEWAYEVQETIRFIPREGSNESVVEQQLPRKHFNKHTEKQRHTIKPIDTSIFFRQYVGYDGAEIEIEVEMTRNYALLEIQDLVSFADRTRYFQTLAQNAFERVHSGKTVKIDIEDWNARKAAVSTNSTISLRKYELILSFLKNFGHLIQDLEINFDYQLNATDEKAQEISKYVNIYCANTLTKLTIDSHQRDLFEEMTKPFANLEEFSMTGSVRNLGNFNKSFSELFPVLRRLKLLRFQSANEECIDTHLEHLENLTINVFKNDAIRAFPINELKKCLQKNPQIKNLHLFHANAKFLADVNATMVNMRSLSLTSYSEFNATEKQKNQNLTIVFGEVTHFAVDGYKPEVPDYVYVPKMVEFRGELQETDKIEKLIDFLKTKQHLRKITIKLPNLDKDAAVKRLRNAFGNPQWVSTTSGNEVALERRD